MTLDSASVPAASLARSVEAESVSVVIPTFNRRERVARAVDSILAGNLLPGEIVVVDDGSTDATEEGLADADRQRVRYLRHERNLGVAAARNRGLAEVTGRWVALLDSDDAWLPHHLEVLLDHLRRHPDCRVVQGWERWYRGGRRVNPRPVHRPPHGDLFEPSLKRCLVSSSAVVLDRAIVSGVGGYDERLPACEDYDLWLRLSRVTELATVEVETIEKDGDRDDQLSNRVWGLDRFRVFALAKLLRCPDLRPDRREAVARVGRKKLKILRGGASKRGRRDDAAAYSRWAEAFESGARGQLEAVVQLLAEAGERSARCDPILDALRPHVELSSPLLSRCERGSGIGDRAKTDRGWTDR